MKIYSKIFGIVEKKTDDLQSQANSTAIANLFKELQSSMIDQYLERLNNHHGYSFLENFDKFWSDIRLYTRWNTTIFNSVDRFLKLHQGTTLLKITLELLRKVIRTYNEKLRDGLLEELLKDRNRNECDTRLIGNLFKAYFEVDYEDRSKIEKVGSTFMYVYDESASINRNENEAQKRGQRTDTFKELMKPRLIEETKQFYSKKVQEWLGMTVPDFLNIANKYLGIEEQRADS